MTANKKMNRNKVKTLYISGQMRSGTTLVSTFLGHNKGIKILVDQARIPTASGQAFDGRPIKFSEPLCVIDRVKLFQSFINVTLWVANGRGKAGMSVALKRLAPFLGYLNQIRSWDDRPFILDEDISSLPSFRTHLDFFEVILEHSVPIINKTTLAYAGNKETRGEKFASDMVKTARGKSVVVIRDPRAVVCSLIEKIQVDPKFGVKSDVSDAISRWRTGYKICKNTPQIHMLRYEDFVQDHKKSVSDLSDYLNVDLVAGAGIEINNSSFSDVEKGALSEVGISRWRDYKDKSVTDEVTQKCKNEIEDLGYDL